MQPFVAKPSPIRPPAWLAYAPDAARSTTAADHNSMVAIGFSDFGRGIHNPPYPSGRLHDAYMQGQQEARQAGFGW